MSQPVGVILAAGRAERMGRPKQLLPYGDTTVLGRVIETVIASGLERVIVVVGSYRDEIAHQLDRDDVEFLTNPDPDRGNLSSLLVASRKIAPAPILLLMADMPGLSTGVIAAHLKAFGESPAWLRLTEYTDRRGHPLMLSPELVLDLENLTGPRVLWRLTADPRTRSLEVDTPMPIDVDTPEDYLEALAQLDATATGEARGGADR